MAPAGTDLGKAGRLVHAAHAVATRLARAGKVKHVGPVSYDRESLNRFAMEYCSFPLPGEPRSEIAADVAPFEGWLFVVDVGQDCEALRIGLCRYPATISRLKQEWPTKLGRGWRFSGFSKTQFASLHGWEHFRRCHTAVVDLLAGLDRLGLHVTISDEGDFWPGRRLDLLRQNLDEMNGIVAAAAGALKDFDEKLNGKSNVQSPIFAHRQFERLEAEGARRVVKKLSALLRS